MAKVYVVTRAKPMQAEVYVTVKATMKAAEKVVRAEYPNARKEDLHPGMVSFNCKRPDGSWELMFIHEETI